MANPKLFNTEGVGATKQSDHFLSIAIGATGAPGAISLSSPAFAFVPLTRTGVGAYTFNMREPWALLLGYTFQTIQATTTIGTDGTSGQVLAVTNLATLGTFTFQMNKGDGTGAAGEIRSGAQLLIWLSLKNNTLNP